MVTGVVLYRNSDAVISYHMLLYRTACCYIITSAYFIGSAAYGSTGRYIVYGHIYFSDIYRTVSYLKNFTFLLLQFYFKFKSISICKNG